MPLSAHQVDEMLLNWGDRLFREPLRHAQASVLRGDDQQRRAQQMRERIARTLAGAPEVMVAISNRAYGVQGMGALRRHLRYISRDGTVGLEDQDGQTIVGEDVPDDLAALWQLAGWGVPERSSRRETLNVLLAMPSGTDPMAVLDAARAFAADEFGGDRLYVFVAHRDTDQPHVHLCVQSRGPDGRRLTHSLRDMSRWRERFAQHLREVGVHANATSRAARGECGRHVSRAVAQMLRRGEVPRYTRAASDADDHRRQWEANGETLAAWRELARALARSERADDRKMAMEIADFVRRMPVVRERLEPTQDRRVMAPAGPVYPGARVTSNRDRAVREAPASAPDAGIDR